MQYSREKLISRFKQGEVLKYVFFWGHTQKNPEIIDKSCFSQWYPSPFVIEGVTYATAEHYMMAEKARLFKDERTRQNGQSDHRQSRCGDFRKPHLADSRGDLGRGVGIGHRTGFKPRLVHSELEQPYQ